jgi:hypothetical protein
MKLTTASSDLYQTTSAAFLTKDKAKRGFLFGFLVKCHRHVVDNLTTKDTLPYGDVKQRLMDIDTSEPEENTSLFSSKPSGNKKIGKKPNRNSDSSSPKSKTCTWCKTHHPRKSKGHTWSEYIRLQKFSKKMNGERGQHYDRD